MSLIKKIYLVLTHPGILFRYKSFKIRKIYYFLSKFLHLKTFYSRKSKIDTKSHLYLRGFEKIEVDTLKKHNLDIDTIILTIKDKVTNVVYTKDQDGIKSIQIQNLFDTNSKVFNFLTSDYLIDKVSAYLGCVPLLAYSSIWYSENKEKFINSSQEFHLDHEDLKQIKGFLYLDDIDENNGAMNLFPLKSSSKVIEEINYNTSQEKKRVKDDAFVKYENEKIVCKGKKGTLYLVDTSQCFHCGARKSSKSRLLLMFQFITPWANHLKWNWKNSEFIKNNNWEIKNLNKIQRKVLGIN